MEKDKIKISLVIPAYNEEKYIGNCLKSIADSNNKFFEIIVVDNGSKDKTVKIASSFKNVKVVEEKTKGVMHARQKGVDASHGNIIAFTDADTLMSDGWTDRIIYEFSKNPKLALLSGPMLYYDVTFIERFLVKFCWYFVAVPVYLFVGYMGVFNNLAISRKILTEMGGLNTSIVFYGDDTDTARRASEFGKVKFSIGFKMYSSARRLENQGLFSTVFQYIINFLSSVLVDRPVTQKYKDFR